MVSERVAQALLPTIQSSRKSEVTKQTQIIVSGVLFSGVKKSQEIFVNYREDQALGEIFWAAIEIVKRLGGLVEEDGDGIVFYPLDSFDGGLRFAEKQP